MSGKESVVNRKSLLLAGIWLLPPAWVTGSDSSIQCDGGIVSTGDTKIDLLGKCGEPAMVEERQSKQRYDTVTILVTTEVWTYNFGPNRFLQFVTVTDGKVTSVERGGYGYPPEQARDRPKPGRARCDPSALHVGDRKIDLLAKCGEPALKDLKLEKRLGGDPAAGSVLVEIETWTFDFGPQRFTQRVILEDGKVVQVERGGYGYAQ